MKNKTETILQEIEKVIVGKRGTGTCIDGCLIQRTCFVG